jgi:glycosyltransferase involved in cell wall biosynthesis
MRGDRYAGPLRSELSNPAFGPIPLRILYIVNVMGRGGVEIQLRDRAVELTKRGHAVAVVSMMPFLDFQEALAAAGVQTLSLNLVAGTALPRELYRCAAFLREFRPDLVHSHLFVATMFARTLRALPQRIRGRWRVLVCSSHSRQEIKRFRYSAYRATNFLGNAWTSVSREGIATHERYRAIAKGTALWTPNGVDLTCYRSDPAGASQMRETFGVATRFMWLAVGSFRDESKDYSTMLRAFATLPGDSLLIIAGDGALRREKEDLAATLGLNQRVRFLGMRTDVEKLLQAADGYVLSSQTEAMPNVLLQAAATEVPIVTTDVGEASEIVEHGEGGLVVPPRDPAALTAALWTIQNSAPDARRRMGRAAKLRVAERFDFAVVVDRWERLYRSLLAAS